MITYLTKIIQKKRRQKRLAVLRREIEKNQEIFHVIRQRQDLMPLQTGAWAEFAQEEQPAPESELWQYARLVQAYQDMFLQMKTREQWYRSSLNNQNRREALALHDQQDKAESALSSLPGCFDKAREEIKAWERRMETSTGEER